MYDIRVNGQTWDQVAAGLGLRSGISKESFAQLLFDNGSTGDFLIDIARTASKYSDNTEGIVFLTAYGNPDNFVQAWYPGIAGYTKPGAYPNGFVRFTKSNSNVSIVKEYYRDLSSQGREALGAEYAKRNKISSSPPEIFTAKVIEISNVDASGKLLSDHDENPILTKIIVSNFPSTIGGGVNGNYTR